MNTLVHQVRREQQRKKERNTLYNLFEWIWAIMLNILVVYMCYKFVTFGISGGFHRLFSRKKKKSDVNSGAKYG